MHVGAVPLIDGTLKAISHKDLDFHYIHTEPSLVRYRLNAMDICTPITANGTELSKKRVQWRWKEVWERQ